MGSISMRGIIAFLILAASLAIYALTDKLSFEQLLIIIGPVTSLYFGQYINPPRVHTDSIQVNRG